MNAEHYTNAIEEIQQCKRYVILSFVPFEGYGIESSFDDKEEAEKEYKKILAKVKPKRKQKNAIILLVDALKIHYQQASEDQEGGAPQ